MYWKHKVVAASSTFTKATRKLILHMFYDDVAHAFLRRITQ